MKLVRPALTAVAATALMVAVVFACGDKSSKTTASAASADGAMPACCAAKKASTATAASMKAKAASAECTAEMAAACTPEMAAHCAAMKGTKSAKNAKRAATSDGCAMHKGASATAASLAGGGNCTGQAMLGAKAMAHGDCNACEDMMNCDEQLSAAGARVQVVPLKNGVMYVYTSDSPGRVRAVQSAVAHRNQRVTSLLTAGDHAKLCSSCKQIRGAMASSKMSREVVNVESGALTLVTSTDKAMVSRILDAANTTLAARTTH